MTDQVGAPFWLQVTEPGRSARVVTLSEPVEVGRDCEGIVLDDPTTSRRHLVLEPQADGVVARDLGSANGTFVEGDRIDEPVLLLPGVTVLLGETELRVVRGRETSSAPEGAGATVDPTHRPSSAARDLNRAANKGGFRGSKRA